jgi:acyl-coenzyme A thioesterase PaaI-like protein
MSMDQRVAAIVASSSFGAKLGGMIDVSEDGALWTLAPRPELIGNPPLPALHGGAVTAFLELACGGVVARRLERSVLPRLISLNVQFLTPIRLRDVRARPDIRRIGRRVAVVHIEAWQDNPGSPACAAQFEFSCIAE